MNENENSGGINKEAIKVIFGVAFILILFYIISLIFDALSNKKTYNWPPWVGKCPDYWTTSTDSEGNTICTKNPINPNGLNQLCEPIIQNYVDSNPNIIKMNDVSDTDKCNWSKNCNVSWENIDNKC